MIRKILIIVVIVIVTVFLLTQLVPYGRGHTNPPVVREPNWDSPRTRELAQRACFDCHSNETVWPWYSNIAPISWLVVHDTEEGRGRLNFSEWNTGMAREGSREAGEVVLEGEMPPGLFTMMHPSAKLSDAERQELAQGLSNSLR